MSHNYVLIMAGGSGTRLYPVSRETTPKHLRKLMGDKTLLQQTYQRASKVVPSENIYISTNVKYVDTILEQIPDLTKDHLITEPVKRNTGPAIALSAAVIHKIDPNAVIATMHSDHQILQLDNFVQAFKTALDVVTKDQDYIMTVGVKPTMAHTGLGYIKREGVFLENKNDFTIFRVQRFVEKPNKETAQQYVDSGNFYWNAGYFVSSAKHFLNEVKKFLPEIESGLTKIADSWGTPKYEEVCTKEFPNFPEVPIDTAIMEKTDKLLVLPAEMGWCDVGSWDVVTSLIDESEKDEFGNYSEGLHISIDSKDTIVMSHDPQKLIATIGLEEIMIVTTEDAILIAKKGQSEKVKKVIEEIKKQKLEHLL